MKLVVVESPAKAKTINKYLGKDYIVLASYGHVRDLPSKDGSVDPEDHFKMKWAMDNRSKKQVADLIAAAKKSDEILLATDPDREGEAISWHVQKVLQEQKTIKDKPFSRVVFHEITKTAILKAIDNPRPLDEALIQAYLARRALDYLVGFNLSPILWRKLPGSRSAGRVQSVALRIITDREAEIEKFVAQEYWSVLGLFATTTGKDFETRLTHLNGEKLEKFTSFPRGMQKQLLPQSKLKLMTYLKLNANKQNVTRRHRLQPLPYNKKPPENYVLGLNARCNWLNVFTKEFPLAARPSV